MSKSYLGIDVHKHECVFTELDSKGKIIRRGRFGNHIEAISDFSSTLQGNEEVVLEPVLNYLWLLDQLNAYVSSVHVATPYKVRVIAESKSKTDRYDSQMLAELLRINFLPESWIPPHDIRQLRDIIRQRHRLVKTIVMHKNYIRHLLFLHGIHLQVSNIASSKARRMINRILIPETIRQSIDQCLQVVTKIEGMVNELDLKIKDLSASVDRVVLLRTIPGIGQLWAATIYAEIGDISRFRSAKALSSYTGLVPTVRTSGESAYYGTITRQGPKLLRKALVEAAIRASRQSPSMNRMYHRILYRSNSQKARVAVAHKLAMIIYKMLKDNVEYINK